MKTLTALLCYTFSTLCHAEALIALDVGHSLAQSGAKSARGNSEFSFNLALATHIAAHMREQQIAHQLIGADGKMQDLLQRTKQAQAAKASFFLAVHHDSAQPQYFSRWQWQGQEHAYADQFSGFSLFVSRKNPQLAQSLRCASEIGMQLQAAGLHPSPHHAENIAGENRAWANQAAGVYYFDDLLVLKSATMPAVLLEAGVIVNRAEELAVQQEARKTLVARAVTQGLLACGALEKSTLPAVPPAAPLPSAPQ